MEARHSNRRAFVTGAASGIGLAVTARLLDEGARVALIDIDGPALADAARQLGDRALPLAADVSDEASIAAAIDEAVGSFGGLDVVVPNAAIQLVGRDDRADRLDLDAWRTTLDTNLTGAFLTAKHGIRALLASGGGSVVCTASAAGGYGLAPGLDAYSASKAGLSGLVRVMAIDYAGDGIRVNAVLPGIIETPMNHWWTNDPAARADVEARVPLGRAGTPDEIAAVIAFLASDDASYVTGALWAVDGGLTAQ